MSVSRFKLCDSISREVEAFKTGFNQVPSDSCYITPRPLSQSINYVVILCSGTNLLEGTGGAAPLPNNQDI